MRRAFRIFAALAVLIGLAWSPAHACMTLTGAGGACGGAAAATTTWNPSDKHASITLSNGNLTATAGASGYESVRAIASASSGLKYYELHLDTNPAAEIIIFGIANSTFAVTGGSFVGQDNNSIGYDPAGSFIFLNSVTSTVQSGTTGDTISIAVDIGNTKFWTRTSCGNWNNDILANQNPATNTGGRSFSTMGAGPYFPALAVNTSPTAATANFGGSAYACTVPAGYVNW